MKALLSVLLVPLVLVDLLCDLLLDRFLGAIYTWYHIFYTYDKYCDCFYKCGHASSKSAPSAGCQRKFTRALITTLCQFTIGTMTSSPNRGHAAPLPHRISCVQHTMQQFDGVLGDQSDPLMVMWMRFDQQVWDRLLHKYLQTHPEHVPQEVRALMDAYSPVRLAMYDYIKSLNTTVLFDAQ